MKPAIYAFYRNDDGAVTVDWVVLTGLIVAMVFFVFIPFSETLSQIALGIVSHLTP